MKPGFKPIRLGLYVIYVGIRATYIPHKWVFGMLMTVEIVASQQRKTQKLTTSSGAMVEREKSAEGTYFPKP
jgi:hypothetical protein